MNTLGENLIAAGFVMNPDGTIRSAEPTHRVHNEATERDARRVLRQESERARRKDAQ